MRSNNKNTDSVGIYLQELGRVPLLSTEQEIQYARKVQRVMELKDYKKALFDELGYEPGILEWSDAAGLTVKELQQILDHGHRAKNKMIEANLRLVVSIAKKYQYRGIELQDLIQEGSLGLNRAVEKFDPSKGNKFSTYATIWIRQSIMRSISDKSRGVRLPCHLVDWLIKVKKVCRVLAQQLGREPSLDELALELSISVEKLRQKLNYGRESTSLDKPLRGIEEICLGDLLVSDFIPEEYVQTIENQDIVQGFLNQLTFNERTVIESRYGFDDGCEKNLSVIGNKMNITRERARQLHKAGIERLKKCSEPAQPVH
jgi:RNA polymerase nonessential primary-like sigma factor